MTTVNVYLTFDGQCEQAFEHYKSVFGGEFPSVSRFGEMPPSDKFSVPDEHKDRIMHMSLPISAETIIMGSDTGGDWSANYKQGNNFQISINTDSRSEADRIFEQLGKGGKVIMPLQETFWGDYFGSFTDKFGIGWMVSFNEKALDKN